MMVMAKRRVYDLARVPAAEAGEEKKQQKGNGTRLFVVRLGHCTGVRRDIAREAQTQCKDFALLLLLMNSFYARILTGREGK